MGYNIYIGEAVVETGLEYGDNDMYIAVNEIECEDAPYWENGKDAIDISGKTNGRHPSYTGFKLFIDEAGLTKLFRNEEYGLMRNHPDTVVIQERDYQVIRNARQKWETEHPKNKAGWTSDKDSILARLIWFEFWFRYALDNCKIPTISNG